MCVSRRGVGKELKIPEKIAVIKSIFKEDDDYVITNGIDPETNRKCITIWWDGKIEKVR